MKRVWYHANCLDGFTAAWIFYRRYGPKQDVEYTPVKYGDSLPVFRAGDDIYILDFSWDRQTLLGLRDDLGPRGKLVVLDHHKTAEKELKGLDFCYFDMERSGAGLAWDFFNRASYSWDRAKRDDRPLLVDLVEDRDLWKFGHPATKTITAYMMSMPMTFMQWDEIHRACQAGGDRMAFAGESILRYQGQLIRRLATKSKWVSIYDTPLLAASTPVLQSEVCNFILETIPEAEVSAAMSSDPLSHSVKWSLRSRPGGVDVSAIAEKFGGGGHHCAAGFKTNINHGAIKLWVNSF